MTRVSCDVGPQYLDDDAAMRTSSEWLVSDQEEELIRLLIVDSDFAEA